MPEPLKNIQFVPSLEGLYKLVQEQNRTISDLNTVVELLKQEIILLKEQKNEECLLNENKFFTIKEAAEYVNKSKLTIWKAVDEGRLNAIGTGGKGSPWRIAKRDLELYIRSPKTLKNFTDENVLATIF